MCGMLSKKTKTKKKKPDVISKTVQLVLILHWRGRAYNEDKLTMKVGTEHKPMFNLNLFPVC